MFLNKKKIEDKARAALSAATFGRDGEPSDKPSAIEKARARVAKLQNRHDKPEVKQLLEGYDKDAVAKVLADKDFKGSRTERLFQGLAEYNGAALIKQDRAGSKAIADAKSDDPYLQKLAASPIFSSGPNREAVTMASHKAMSQAKPEITEDTNSTTSWKGGGNYEYKLDKASGDIFITKAPDGGYTGKVRGADPLTSIKAELATLKPTPAPKVDTSADSKPPDTSADSKPPELSPEQAKIEEAAAQKIQGILDFRKKHGRMPDRNELTMMAAFGGRDTSAPPITRDDITSFFSWLSPFDGKE